MSVSYTHLLDKGENEIRILFRSPVNYVKEKYKSCPTPINSNGQNGIVHIRKPQCHFGWDWGPVLPVSYTHLKTLITEAVAIIEQHIFQLTRSNAETDIFIFGNTNLS